MMCGLYVLGFMQGVNMQADVFSSPKKLFCTPDGVTGEQGRSIVTKYLNDHPEQRHEQMRVLVPIALMQAFPCSGQ